MQVDQNFKNGFSGLSQLALSELRVLGECSVVCGPISTGGTGSVEANVKLIADVMVFLTETKGVKFFNHLFYEKHIKVLKEKWESYNEGYCMPILDQFYAALYQSGYIKTAYFLPNWETSHGATREREFLPKCRISIVDIKLSEIEHLLPGT
jgi:hypothetical protein